MNDKHLPALDGLRGIAALFVVLSHYLIDSGWSKEIGRHIGTVGVMLFFCLSGFLMMHVTNGKRPTYQSIMVFYARRLARVVPLFVIALVVILGYQVTAKSFGIPTNYLAFNPIDNVQNMFLNLLSVRGDGVFWTIGPEILFYLLFPIFWMARTRSLATLFLAVAVVYAIQRASGFWVDWGLNFTRLNMIIHYFLFGYLAYCAFASPVWKQSDGQLRDSIFLVVGLAAVSILPGISRIVYGVDLIPHEFRAMFVAQPLLWLVFPCLILAAVSSPLSRTIFCPPVFTFLGAISYSMYIWHTPVVRASMYFRQTSTLGRALMLIVVIAAVLVVSYISYRWIEKPARERINDWVDRQRARNSELAHGPSGA